jgi:thioredoxin 1
MSGYDLIYSANVKIITDANFESEVLGASVPVVVFFYAPWEGHCKIFASAFQRVADEEYGPESEDAGKMIFGTLRGDENATTCDAYGVSRYPSVKIFTNGQFEDYIGSYERYAFSDYCKRNLFRWLSGSTVEEAEAEADR